MDGMRAKFGLHESLGFQITRTARTIERRVESGLRDYGLTRVGWCILLAVEEEGLKNPSEIAQFVGIDRTATSRALRQLEDDGPDRARDGPRGPAHHDRLADRGRPDAPDPGPAPLCREHGPFQRQAQPGRGGWSSGACWRRWIPAKQTEFRLHTGGFPSRSRPVRQSAARQGLAQLDEVLGRHSDRGRTVHDPGIVHQDEIEHAGQEFRLGGPRPEVVGPAPVEPRNTSTRSSRDTSQPSARIAAVSAIPAACQTPLFMLKGLLTIRSAQVSEISKVSRHKWMRKA
jgi:hypothetical protein